MPRNGSGVYSLPAGTDNFVALTVIESAKIDAITADLQTDANTARPITAGGTGGATVIAANDALQTQGTDIASAATLVLTTATGPMIDITGTTTVTAVTLTTGKQRMARAVGAFTLTASASLVVNRSTTVSYTTTAGDLLIFEGYAAGVVYVWVVGNSSGYLPLTGGTLTGAVTISGTSSLFNALNLITTDPGTLGPALSLYHKSASPAASDTISFLNFYGRNTSAADIAYAQMTVAITDPTAGSEDSAVSFVTYIAGGAGARMVIGNGITTPGQTDMGFGTINATALYQNGVAVSSGTAATQAEQEAASSTTVFVTPGRQQFHPSAAKCWAYITVSGGTPTLATSYNITSITDTAAGQVTVTIATDFSSTSWMALVSYEAGSTSNSPAGVVTGKTATALTISYNGGAGDPTAWNFMGMGDQ